MRWHLLALLAFLSSCAPIARDGQPDGRNLHYAVQIGESYGAIDHTGRLVVQPQAHYLNFGNDLNPSPDGLIWYAVSTEETLLYGLMEVTGRIIVQAKYHDARPFSLGLAWVCTFEDPNDSSSRQWTVIDRTGHERFTPRPYKEVFEFTVDGAWVDRWNPDLPYIIDEQGDQIFVPPNKEQWTGPAREGLAYFRDDAKGKIGFVDRSGTVVIPALYDETGDFKDGRCWVRIDGIYDTTTNIYHWRGGRLGIIDHSGHWLHTVDADWIGAHAEGRTPCLRKTAGWGLIDDDGRWIVGPRKDLKNILPFSEGRAGAQTDAGWGLLDHQGNWVVTPRFLEIDDRGFSQGMLQVFVSRQGSQVAGRIDRQGRWVIPPGKDGSYQREELLQISNRSAYPIAYTDMMGRYVWPPELRGHRLNATNNDPADQSGAEAQGTDGIPLTSP